MTVSAAKPTRRALPDHLPRETCLYEPKEKVCPRCQGELHLRTTRCDCIAQAEASSRPIERGIAGPGLLAHVLVSTHCDHLPLFRQSKIYARQGAELERSTTADWVGESSKLLEPLVDALRRYVLSAGKLDADDKPVPVLAQGQGKAKTGRIHLRSKWTPVRSVH